MLFIPVNRYILTYVSLKDNTNDGEKKILQNLVQHTRMLYYLLMHTYRKLTLKKIVFILEKNITQERYRSLLPLVDLSTTRGV